MILAGVFEWDEWITGFIGVMIGVTVLVLLYCRKSKKSFLSIRELIKGDFVYEGFEEKAEKLQQHEEETGWRQLTGETGYETFVETEET